MKTSYSKKAEQESLDANSNATETRVRGSEIPKARAFFLNNKWRVDGRPAKKDPPNTSVSKWAQSKPDGFTFDPNYKTNNPYIFYDREKMTCKNCITKRRTRGFFCITNCKQMRKNCITKRRTISVFVMLFVYITKIREHMFQNGRELIL